MQFKGNILLVFRTNLSSVYFRESQRHGQSKISNLSIHGIDWVKKNGVLSERQCEGYKNNDDDTYNSLFCS